MKGLYGGVRVFPGWTAQCINDQRDSYKNNAAEDKHREPYRIASRIDLRRRYKAQDKCQQCSQKADSGHNPDQAVAVATDGEGAGSFGHFIP